MRSTLSCLFTAVIATSVLAQDPEEIVVVEIGRASCRERV